jgi:hypothetical protein
MAPHCVYRGSRVSISLQSRGLVQTWRLGAQRLLSSPHHSIKGRMRNHGVPEQPSHSLRGQCIQSHSEHHLSGGEMLIRMLRSFSTPLSRCTPQRPHYMLPFPFPPSLSSRLHPTTAYTFYLASWASWPRCGPSCPWWWLWPVPGATAPCCASPPCAWWWLWWCSAPSDATVALVALGAVVVGVGFVLRVSVDVG